eukprot:TRINITY_DN13965_c0_g1_i1.p1 TRINITY_DN13965_c0_g1~~TRINITY_DN13965_c0_g1_i1.p1  ORF type:complete len:251 (+),score=38.94 TRINITY_DN13965_c0_g1_i1:60-812(+)
MRVPVGNHNSCRRLCIGVVVALLGCIAATDAFSASAARLAPQLGIREPRARYPVIQQAGSMTTAPGIQALPGRDDAKERRRKLLTKVSNYASLLCVLDCTVLPAVLTLLPIIGLANPGNMEFLHSLSHNMALYFVLPVGGCAATTNYFRHRRWWLALMSACGLLCVYLANGHGGPLRFLPHHIRHMLHCCGPAHRLTNMMGCALLMSSNYISHRIAKAEGLACCASDACKGGHATAKATVVANKNGNNLV